MTDKIVPFTNTRKKRLAPYCVQGFDIVSDLSDRDATEVFLECLVWSAICTDLGKDLEEMVTAKIAEMISTTITTA